MIKRLYLIYSGDHIRFCHLSQSGSRSNDNVGVRLIPHSTRTEASLSDDLVSYPGHCGGGGLSFEQRYNLHII